MFQIDVDVDYKGPLFDGRAESAIEHGISEGVWAATKETRGELGLQFLRVFKEPTGNYESHVRALRESPTAGLVTDFGIDVYNHWLEGTGSRNFPVTTFKGYGSFKQVTELMDGRTEAIVRRHIDAALEAVGA